MGNHCIIMNSWLGVSCSSIWCNSSSMDQESNTFQSDCYVVSILQIHLATSACTYSEHHTSWVALLQ